MMKEEDKEPKEKPEKEDEDLTDEEKKRRGLIFTSQMLACHLSP